MADSSHQHHGDQQHSHDPHNWTSSEYVSKWAKGQDPKEIKRQEAFGLLADTIPYEKSAPIKILDIALYLVSRRDPRLRAGQRVTTSIS